MTSAEKVMSARRSSASRRRSRNGILCEGERVVHVTMYDALCVHGPGTPARGAVALRSRRPRGKRQRTRAQASDGAAPSDRIT